MLYNCPAPALIATLVVLAGTISRNIERPPLVTGAMPTLPMVLVPAFSPTTPVPSVGSSTLIAEVATPCPCWIAEPATCVRLEDQGPLACVTAPMVFAPVG